MLTVKRKFILFHTYFNPFQTAHTAARGSAGLNIIFIKKGPEKGLFDCLMTI